MFCLKENKFFLLNVANNFSCDSKMIHRKLWSWNVLSLGIFRLVSKWWFLRINTWLSGYQWFVYSLILIHGVCNICLRKGFLYFVLALMGHIWIIFTYLSDAQTVMDINGISSVFQSVGSLIHISGNRICFRKVGIISNGTHSIYLDYQPLHKNENNQMKSLKLLTKALYWMQLIIFGLPSDINFRRVEVLSILFSENIPTIGLPSITQPMQQPCEYSKTTVF